MARLLIDNIYTRIEGSFPFEKVDEILSYPVPGWWFNKKLKQWYPDGKKHLLIRPFNKFPTGYLTDVIECLRDNRYRCKIFDNRVNPKPMNIFTIKQAVDNIELVGIDELRKYQSNAIFKAVVMRRGIIKSATGSGKTEMFIGIISVLGVKTLVIIYGIKLVEDTRNRIAKRLGVDVGIITGGSKVKYSELPDITVTSIDTFYRRRNSPALREYLSEVDCLIVDEAHQAAAPKFLKVLKLCPAYYRYHVSATPLNEKLEHDALVKSYSGDMIVDIPNRKMQKLGYVATPVINMITIGKVNRKDFRERHMYNLGWQAAYDKLIVHNELRNNILADQAHYHASRKRKTLMFVTRIDHGKILLEKLNKLGTRARFIWGKDNTDTRNKVEDELVNGQINCIIASTIYDFGIDIPEVDSIILAGSGKEKQRLLQRIGRGMRPKEGINKVWIVDTIDVCNKHIKKWSMNRLDTYLKEQSFIIKIDGKEIEQDVAQSQ